MSILIDIPPIKIIEIYKGFQISIVPTPDKKFDISKSEIPFTSVTDTRSVEAAKLWIDEKSKFFI